MTKNPWRPLRAIAGLMLGAGIALSAMAREVLPFPPKPSGSIALPTKP